MLIERINFLISNKEVVKETSKETYVEEEFDDGYSTIYQDDPVEEYIEENRNTVDTEDIEVKEITDVTIELEPLFYSIEKVNLIYDIIHKYAINPDVVELKKNYDIVYKCPKCNGVLFFEPLDGIKNYKYYCEKCNEFYDTKDIIKDLEEVKIIND